MRFSTPWSPDPDAWAKYVPELRSPGLEAECAGPIPGLPPVVQRFHDFFILPEGPLEIPTPPPVARDMLYYTLSASPVPPPGQDIPTGASARPAAPPPPVRSWQVVNLLWGVHVSYEQAWHWLGSSLGELVESISLTPGEELEIQVYTWDRTKLSKDLEATDLVDQKYETSLTMHDSSQIVKRMEKERNWEFGANVGFSYGVTVGMDFNIGGSTSDTMERRREQKQEFTSKTAQQVRSERKTKISTVRETGIEQRRRRLIKNENPTRSVTYNFYETLSHYRVEIAPVEIVWAVAIPNELPSITPEWIVCHEGILREHLLDPYKEEAFSAAQRLAKRCPTNIVAEALSRLYHAFTAQTIQSSEMPYTVVESENVPCRVEYNMTINGLIQNALRIGQVVDAFFAGGGNDLLGQAYHLAGIARRDPAPYFKINANFEYVAGFLQGAVLNPTLAGLLAGLKLVSDWYQPNLVQDPVSYWFNYCPMSKLAESALGFAASVIITASGGALANASSAEEGAEESPVQPLAATSPEQTQALEERLADQALFDGLKCHIEENLLYYMRPIWIAEDAGQRHARLAHQLLGGTAEEAMLATLIEDRLLGFHLNCSVFPVRMGPELEAALEEAVRSDELPGGWPAPQGPLNLISLMRKTGSTKKSAVRKHFEQLARNRFQASARELLDQTMKQALSYVENCGASDMQKAGKSREPAPLTPQQLPEVISDAEQRIQEALAAAKKRPESNLTKEEQETKVQVEQWLEHLSSVALKDEVAVRITNDVANASRVGRQVEENQDLKPIVVSLPDGGYHCEPVVGRCSAAEPLREREIEADLILREAESEQAKLETERRSKRLEAGKLAPESSLPVFRLKLEKADEG